MADKLTKFGVRTARGEIVKMPDLDAFGHPYVKPINTHVLPSNNTVFVVLDGSRRLTADQKAELQKEYDGGGADDEPDPAPPDILVDLADDPIDGTPPDEFQFP